MKTLLVTGGLGFIGSNLIMYLMDKYPDYHIINWDCMTYAANEDNISSCYKDSKRYQWYDVEISFTEEVNFRMPNKLDGIINLAAETHVDFSIQNPSIFYRTNIIGTQNLLEHARKRGIRFLQVSTDEVYGGSPGPTGFTETTPLDPSSPYSSSKASADLMCLSYFKTFDTDVVITRCSNNYGERQDDSKLIPKIISLAAKDKPIPIFGDGLNVRDWLYVGDHCEAIDLAFHKGKSGEVYNVGGNNEKTNLDVCSAISGVMNKPLKLEMVDDRLAHDRRYSIDATKIKEELGWEPKTDFRDGLEETVKWKMSNL
jgi:dTDP-glucose 4,6-dehydratase